MKQVMPLLVICTLLLTGCIQGQTIAQQDETLRIGAVLPLSGPLSLYGEQVWRGMELAVAELQEQGIDVRVIYEDGEGNTQKSLAAYQRLIQQDVDATVSAVSSVSMPMVPLSKQYETPHIMTVVAANNATAGSEYAFRYYATAKEYAEPHFRATLPAHNITQISILAEGGSYGESVAAEIRQLAKETNITVVGQELFARGDADVRSQLLKLDAQHPQAILLVMGTPADVHTIFSQAYELNIDANLVESGNLLSASQALRDDLGYVVEGVYGSSFATSAGMTSGTFVDRHRHVYGTTPNFAEFFGYDIVHLLVQAQQEGAGRTLYEKMHSLDTFNGVNGVVQIQQNGEINPSMLAVRVHDGSVVPVEQKH